MGFGAWDIAGCDCGCGSACSQTFTVQGCISGLAGATVEVWDSGGTTLLQSGTTNGSGQVTLTWTGTGSIVAKVTGMSARFAAFSQSMTVTCGGTRTLSLSAATGYSCCAACNLPLANTLFLTDSIVGAVTLTHSGSTWTGTVVYSYPQCVTALTTCVAVSVTLTYTFQCTGSGSFSCTVSGKHVTGGPGVCCPGGPFNTGTISSFASNTAAGSCPTSFLWSAGFTDTTCNLYCGATATITVTE